MSFFRADAIAIHFGGIKAVDGVSFDVEKGEIFTIIGPNGAGKSTMLDIITGRLVDAEFSRGCLIGELSLEAAPQSELLRTRLSEIFAEWCAPFAACIAEAQDRGEIAATFPPEELAEFLLASWEGAILRMKVTRTAEPLERFKRIAFATVFQEAS